MKYLCHQPLILQIFSYFGSNYTQNILYQDSWLNFSIFWNEHSINLEWRKQNIIEGIGYPLNMVTFLSVEHVCACVFKIDTRQQQTPKIRI